MNAILPCNILPNVVLPSGVSPSLVILTTILVNVAQTNVILANVILANVVAAPGRVQILDLCFIPLNVERVNNGVISPTDYSVKLFITPTEKNALAYFTTASIYNQMIYFSRANL